VPEGRVVSEGWIGPWNQDHPTDVPLGGTYTFALAQLGTIRGIGGLLESTGTYEGRLTSITVVGETRTPDFSLDLGGSPLPLTTRFTAIVDGSDGTTVLERVDGTLLDTPIVVSGRIDNLPGPGRRHIDLTAEIRDGRIEDVLRLTLDAKTPLLIGDVSLTSRITLPPGPGSVRSRLVLDGTFGLEQARFTDDEAEAKLIELSRRSQGKDESERASRVLTSLHGQFKVSSGVLSLSGVRFRVPGATVTVDGTYAMASGDLDLTGTLRMQASVSRAVGGFKSLFLKPFDWLFRRDGAGAVVPITITGSPRNPDIGVSIRRAIRRRDAP
jgi:hypothetical protein